MAHKIESSFHKTVGCLYRLTSIVRITLFFP